MREERHVEGIDEAMVDEKLTWEKPVLKVFPVDDTAYGNITGSDALNGNGSGPF